MRGNQILPVVQKMESSFQGIEDYFCEVEQFFYQEGREEQRYRFRFYFKKEKHIRVDFISPYSGMSIFYQGGREEATVRPFRSIPTLRLKFSIHNPLLKTVAGQTLDQTDMGYFIQFLMRNLKGVKQEGNEYQEDEGEVLFSLRAMDYIEDKTLEHYRIHLSKKHWLPVRIERSRLDGTLLEVTLIKDYVINGQLDRLFFVP